MTTEPAVVSAFRGRLFPPWPFPMEKRGSGEAASGAGDGRPRRWWGRGQPVLPGGQGPVHPVTIGATQM